MLKLLDLRSRDDGTSALLIAAAMVLLMGMAAVAIDVGAGFVERRGDQSATDVGTVGGALEVVTGTSDGGGVTTENMVAEALAYIRANLPTTYSDPEWQTIWEGCVDAAAERNNQPGDNFVALSPPAAWGWTPVDPANWCVSVDAAKSEFRVRSPDQLVDTSFAQFVGFDSISTHAAAVAGIIPGEGNIIPFGFPSTAADGSHQCLSSAPTGLAEDPCAGSDAGNFGTLKLRRFTPSPYNGCTVAPQNQVLALNIAAGADHTIVPDVDGVSILDECYNFLVDTLQTDPGFPQGTEEGMVTGAGLPAGETARLKQGPQPKLNVVGHSIDDTPLWHWLLSGLDYTGLATPADPSDDAPVFCDSAGFTSGAYDVDYDGVPEAVYDFDGDGVDEPLDSWQHMQRCLVDYAAAANNYGVIFALDLGNKDTSDWSARFGYVPQFHEPTLGTGITWRRVWRYRAVFILGTWFKKGNTWVVHFPGEGCGGPCGGNNYQLKQVSSWIIPDRALPPELRGDPPSAGIGNITPFKIELTR